MKLFKQMKEKYKNYKISHNMIKIFKSCKKAHSIPIFRLKEYALLAKTAKPHEEKYIKITKYMPNIYYEFDISNNIHLHITKIKWLLKIQIWLEFYIKEILFL